MPAVQLSQKNYDILMSWAQDLEKKKRRKVSFNDIVGMLINEHREAKPIITY